MEDRIAALESAFQGEAMKTQMKIWTEERDEMRKRLQEFWGEHSSIFTEYWKEGSEDDTRIAMIMTVIEDVPSSQYGSLLAIACPELQELQERIINHLEGSKGDVNSLILQIFRSLIDSNEHLDVDFNQSSFLPGPNDNEEKNTVSRPKFAAELLNVARSCSLLHFATCLYLLFANEELEIKDAQGNEQKDDNEAELLES